MQEDTVFDSTDKGTLCPNVPPLLAHGDAYFPMKLPDYPPEIRLPDTVNPDNPPSLFTMYYTPEIIDWIVEKTNQYVRNP